MRLIGIFGELNSGKDTVANILANELGYDHMSVASPMKSFCAEVFGWPANWLWGESRLRNMPDKRYPRGNEFDFPRVAPGSIWVKINGGHALVDEADYDSVSGYSWSVKEGYCSRYARMTSRHKPSKYMHALVVGDASPGMVIDHVNGNGLDNRRSNLRFCSTRQNGMGRKPNRRAGSPFKGVRKYNNGDKWKSAIKINGIDVTIGVFDSEEEAALAYDERAEIEFGTFARTNSQCFVTPRYALQELGAIGRGIHEDIWISCLLNRINESEINRVVVSDLRFSNEIDAIRSRGGVICKVSRPGTKKTKASAHISEAGQASIPDSAFDTIIVNDGTIDDLRCKVLDFEHSIWQR